MINKRKTLHLVILVIVFFILSLSFMFIGTEIGLAVSVKPILPENQHDPEVTYYDLRMNPGQEQALQLELTNTSNRQQKVTMQINDATTNEIGDIDYSDRSKIVSRDESLETSLKDVATVESELTIPANKSMTATVHLKMPKQRFDGMILGGIKVVSAEKSIEPREAVPEEKKTYIVAVKLTETDVPVVAKLNLLGVVSETNLGKKAIKATIQNDQAINVEDIEYIAKIYKKNSDKIIHQAKVTGYRMAPNSSFTFHIAEEKQVFQDGTYQIHLTAKSKATNQEWEWDKEFKITKNEEKKTTNTAIGSDKSNLMLYITICVMTLSALLIFLLVLLISRKRKEKRYVEALYQKKKKRGRTNKASQQVQRPRNNKLVSTRKKRPISSEKPRRPKKTIKIDSD